MIDLRSALSTYGVYGSGLGISKGLWIFSSGDKMPSTDTVASAVKTAAPVIEEAVRQSAFYVQDGRVFIYDLAMTEVISLVIGVVSLIFLLGRGISDGMLTYNRIKLNKVLERTKKK